MPVAPSFPLCSRLWGACGRPGATDSQSRQALCGMIHIPILTPGRGAEDRFGNLGVAFGSEKELHALTVLTCPGPRAPRRRGSPRLSQTRSPSPLQSDTAGVCTTASDAFSFQGPENSPSLPHPGQQPLVLPFRKAHSAMAPKRRRTSQS